MSEANESGEKRVLTDNGWIRIAAKSHEEAVAIARRDGHTLEEESADVEAIREEAESIAAKLADSDKHCAGLARNITTLRNLLDALDPSPESGAEAETMAELLERLAEERDAARAEVERLTKANTLGAEAESQIARERDALRAALTAAQERFRKIIVNCNSAFAADSMNGPKPFVDLIGAIARAGKDEITATIYKPAPKD